MGFLEGQGASLTIEKLQDRLSLLVDDRCLLTPGWTLDFHEHRVSLVPHEPIGAASEPWLIRQHDKSSLKNVSIWANDGKYLFQTTKQLCLNTKLLDPGRYLFSAEDKSLKHLKLCYNMFTNNNSQGYSSLYFTEFNVSVSSDRRGSLITLCQISTLYSFYWHVQVSRLALPKSADY